MSERLKICHLSKYYPPDFGGIESHVRTLALGQLKSGLIVKVLCINSFPKHKKFTPSSKTIHEVDDGIHVVRLRKILTFARFDLCPSLVKHLYYLAQEEYDIIHLHTPNPTMLIAWLIFDVMSKILRFKKPKLVVTHHSDVVKQKVLKQVLRPFEYLVYRDANCILLTSPNYFDGSKFLKLFKSKICILPLGIDLSPYLNPSGLAIAFARDLEHKFAQPRWLCVSRFVYYKAIHIAIEALQYTPGVLMIVGVGPLDSELKAYAEAIGVNKRIEWMGRLEMDELVGAYHAATAFWFPSNVRSEAFGLVQVEAMASQCPVINTEIAGSGVPWVSRNEREGFTVPINDAKAFSDAANRVLRDEAFRKRLSIAAQSRAKAEFSDQTMVSRCSTFYYKVLNLREPEKKLVGLTTHQNL
ncbi:MAG: glycosyltransferase [Thermosynechococcaceae cyanobacterium MS004]|nr:glycosyltransferase [Thermosynechococcaceae cyanobacterium MS004]